MPYLPDPLALAQAFSSGSLPDRGKQVRFSVVAAGQLTITSGTIAASDPLVCGSPAPFSRPVPAGRHPVRLAMAQFEDGDARVAFAQVDFQDRPAVAWEPAVGAGQDVASLGEDEFFGYGVDAGTGCFMDPVAGELLEARMDAEPSFHEAIIEGMASSGRAAGEWTMVQPSPDRPENVVCFSSGWGDGVYPSSFGLAEDGSPCALLTDFLVLQGKAPPSKAPPPRWRRWWRRLVKSRVVCRSDAW